MIPIFTEISKNEIKKIHEASLRVLSEVGIIADDPETINLIYQHGGSYKDKRIYLPNELVEKCLKLCPNKVVLKGKSTQIVLGDGDLHVHNMGGAREVFDKPGGDLRPATTEDVAISTRLLEAMENVSSITPLYTPRDVPSNIMILTMLDQTLRNTTKPINGPGVRSRNEVVYLAEMIRVIYGDIPSVTLGVSPVSPLNFIGEIPQVMFEVARQGLPFGPLPCPNVGVTSPMSLSGSLVQQNAENLASIVLAQMIKPGLPIVYCGRLSVLNMRSGAPIWGNPEIAILSAATVQLGHYYKLPVNVYGLAASGYTCDIQSGYERAINALVPALAGADELSGVGEMAGGVISSNAQIVIDNDIIGMIKRIRRGFMVNDDALAVDVIKRVMESSKNYLREQHTKKYLHAGEIWEGKLGIKESSWEAWEIAGKPDAPYRAQAYAEKILSEHHVPLLDTQQINELELIIQNARENLVL